MPGWSCFLVAGFHRGFKHALALDVPLLSLLPRTDPPRDDFMHCIELAELASLLAYHAPALFALRPSIDQDALTRYWVQSRQRLDQWHKVIAEYSSLETAGRPLAMQVWWDEHEALLEEILVSETLTRVFAAVGVGLDAVTDQREVEPVTHSVFLSHLEARNRVLQLILFGRGGSITQTMELNRLRRASERWTDRILAPIIACHYATHAYAVDAQRAIAYAHEWRESADTQSQAISATLARAAMQATLATRTRQHGVLTHSNREVAQAVIACLHADAFDSLGLLKSVAAIRIQGSSFDEYQSSHLQQVFPTVMPTDHRRGNYPAAARWLM